jgi:hypothetical protein
MKLIGLILIPLLALGAWLFAGRAQTGQTLKNQTQGSYKLSVGGKRLGLAWAVLQATTDKLEPFAKNTNAVQFVWPKQAKLLGAKWSPPSVRVGFRAAVPLEKVFENRHKQLLAQGFTQQTQTMGEREARASYQRANDTLELRVELVQNGVYRSSFDLTGFRQGN